MNVIVGPIAVVATRGKRCAYLSQIFKNVRCDTNGDRYLFTVGHHLPPAPRLLVMNYAVRDIFQDLLPSLMKFLDVPSTVIRAKVFLAILLLVRRNPENLLLTCNKR